LPGLVKCTGLAAKDSASQSVSLAVATASVKAPVAVGVKADDHAMAAKYSGAGNPAFVG
jgi:hypothetical protein